MKKKVIILLLSIVSISAFAQQENRGINFFKGTYAEAVEKAKLEKKHIFIDFYTEWCGPCLVMAENVFPLSEVGEIYNDKFICMKIDAEKGEGVELSTKFQVYSYPTYIFINPKYPDEVLHKSGGNKSAKFFILDAKFATTPKQNSVYMDARYKSGKYDDNFLKTYILQKRALGDFELTNRLFDELIERGYSLTDSNVWKLYVDCINGYDNAYVRELSANYSKFVELYGREAVDSKLLSATFGAPNKVLLAMCDFEGKNQNIKINDLSNAVRSKKYETAVKIIDDLLNDPKQKTEPLYERLSFYLRIIPGRKLEVLPWEWRVKQVEYLRYIAYNCENKLVPIYHYNYAMGLEFLIRYSQELGKVFPEYLTATPQRGKKVYDLRIGTLKQKNKSK